MSSPCHHHAIVINIISITMAWWYWHVVDDDEMILRYYAYHHNRVVSKLLHIFAWHVLRGASRQWSILKSSCIVNHQLNMLFFNRSSRGASRPILGVFWVVARRLVTRSQNICFIKWTKHARGISVARRLATIDLKKACSIDDSRCKNFSK